MMLPVIETMCSQYHEKIPATKELFRCKNKWKSLVIKSRLYGRWFNFTQSIKLHNLNLSINLFCTITKNNSTCSHLIGNKVRYFVLSSDLTKYFSIKLLLYLIGLSTGCKYYKSYKLMEEFVRKYNVMTLFKIIHRHFYED